MSKKKRNRKKNVNRNQNVVNNVAVTEEKVEDLDVADEISENGDIDDAVSEEMYQRDMDVQASYEEEDILEKEDTELEEEASESEEDVDIKDEEVDAEDQEVDLEGEEVDSEDEMADSYADEDYDYSEDDEYTDLDDDSETEDDCTDSEDEYTEDEYIDDDDDFLEEEPYVIKLDKQKKTSKAKKDKKKSEDKGIKSLALIFAWLVFALLVVVFYFYFMDKLPFFGKDKGETSTEALEYEITYETNAHEDINKLITDYYQAMAACDQSTLQNSVVDASVFDDMRFYEEKQKVMTEYKNINVYTLPGYFTGDYVAYVTYDSVIADVNSPLADIQCYYISNTDKGYKINNTKLDPAIVTYMNDQLNQADIQGLYKSVKDKVDECLELDPTFKAFYDNLISNTTEEE